MILKIQTGPVKWPDIYPPTHIRRYFIVIAGFRAQLAEKRRMSYIKKVHGILVLFSHLLKFNVFFLKWALISALFPLQQNYKSTWEQNHCKVQLFLTWLKPHSNQSRYPTENDWSPWRNRTRRNLFFHPSSSHLSSLRLRFCGEIFLMCP